jgi:hypothetical protein
MSYYIQECPDTRDWPVCTQCDEPRNERLYQVGQARLCSTCNEAVRDNASQATPAGARKVCAELQRIYEAGETLAEIMPNVQRHEEVCLECLYNEEPECSCTQSDVDMFDARGCELHDSRSKWNRRRRAVTMVERYETYMPEVA